MFGVYWVAMVSCQICFVSLVLTSVDYLSVKLTYSCLRSSAVSHCVSKFRPMFGDLYWSTTWSQVQCMPFDRHVVDFSCCLIMVLFLPLIVLAGLLVCLLSRLIVSVVLHWRLLVIWFLIVLWLGVFLSCLAVLSAPFLCLRHVLFGFDTANFTVMGLLKAPCVFIWFLTDLIYAGIDQCFWIAQL